LSNRRTTGVFWTNILEVLTEKSPWPKGIEADIINAVEIPVSLNCKLVNATIMAFDVNLRAQRSLTSFFKSSVHW